MQFLVLIPLIILLLFSSFIFLVFDAEEGEASVKVLKDLKKIKGILVYIIVACIVMVGLTFMFVYMYKDNTILANAKLITLVAILFTVTFTDYKRQIIPNKVIATGILVRFVYAVIEFLTMGKAFFQILKSDLFSLIFVAILLFLGVILIKNGIGMGDIKLFLVMGLYQGIAGLISSLFFSLIIAFFAAIGMLITRKKSRKDSMAFAPFVLLGTILSIYLTGI